ncbi:hypothetical protein [Sorangium atrum]|uniref:PGRS family protein n=1 Tax=Sorangium atrum TaxID=2995308 RepID=A0ABT5C2T9_9BACT|nr:hypothetical protein [Sorangium aterium]MDC0680717.1 hypothetical protein [Sorangium aterium]
MRKALGGLTFVLAAAGCDSFWSHLADDCELLVTCEHFYPSGTGGSVPNPGCEADPTQDASTVTDECAVFASATAEAGGDGTKARPYVSLGEAVANAKGKRVLACASGTFPESVTIEAGVEVIGGFDCGAGWAWSQDARSTIEGPADDVALTLSEAASGVKVRSFAVRVASATVAGGSSIGVAVADIEAELAQVEVTAGDGMDGEDGATPAEAPQAGASAPEMTASNACDLPVGVQGGKPGITTCDDGETHGGVGGLGGITETEEGNGQKGTDGAPLPEPNPDEYGLGGAGQTVGNCRQGEPGAPGTTGDSGVAGSGTTLLTLSGIAGGDGANGTTGKKGQGGGGGGGAKAGLFCKVGAGTFEGPGASGGGGGAGGCGGKGGGGGKAGGSSLGIVSLGTKLALTEVSIAVGKAGKGGNGAGGRGGALGGSGATGGTPSSLGGSAGCDGGRGGQGGMGGPGAGGRGGHAVGIAYAAAPGAAVTLANFMVGTAGDGGGTAPGGNAGEAGVSGECWDFTGNVSCGQ